MGFSRKTASLAAACIIAAAAPAVAGDLTAGDGFPQLKTAFTNDGTAARKMAIEVSPAGNAICTFSVEPGGQSRTFDKDFGTPQHAEVTVPGGGKIVISATKGSAPKPAPGQKAADPNTPTDCHYSISDSNDLSQ
ncbi:MAG TPA: hypothetical protein VGK20_05010 [Candidatus Binatia bacterium]|jgi:hypothetical protein